MEDLPEPEGEPIEARAADLDELLRAGQDDLRSLSETRLAGLRAGYLTVSEIFPLETRALEIAFFYAISAI